MLYYIKVCFPIENDCFNDDGKYQTVDQAAENVKKRLSELTSNSETPKDHWDTFTRFVADWYLTDWQDWHIEVVRPNHSLNTFTMNDVLIEYPPESNENKDAYKEITIEGQNYYLVPVDKI